MHDHDGGGSRPKPVGALTMVHFQPRHEKGASLGSASTDADLWRFSCLGACGPAANART